MLELLLHSVDGVQQGGVETAMALPGCGQSQVVAVQGSFGPVSHQVTVNLLNGSAAGGLSVGPNLYVDSLSYDNVAVQGSQSALTTLGAATMTTPVVQPDTLTLSLSEDAWQGDAQAVVTLDGVVIDTPTITTPNFIVTAQTLSYTGNFGGPGVRHVVVVSFLNDAYAGPGQDRNLYVQGITFDSSAVISQTASLRRGGPVSFAYIPAPAQPPSFRSGAPMPAEGVKVTGTP